MKNDKHSVPPLFEKHNVSIDLGLDKRDFSKGIQYNSLSRTQQLTQMVLMTEKDLETNRFFIHMGNTKEYFLLCLANRECSNQDFIPTAVYKDVKTGKVYSRSIHEFMTKFMPSDRQLHVSKEADLKSRNNEKYGDAVSKCQHAGAYCIEDGYCHYDGDCFKNLSHADAIKANEMLLAEIDSLKNDLTYSDLRYQYAVACINSEIEKRKEKKDPNVFVYRRILTILNRGLDIFFKSKRD